MTFLMILDSQDASNSEIGGQRYLFFSFDPIITIITHTIHVWYIYLHLP